VLREGPTGMLMRCRSLYLSAISCNVCADGLDTKLEICIRLSILCIFESVGRTTVGRLDFERVVTTQNTLPSLCVHI
jgi:hypothetical protein